MTVLKDILLDIVQHTNGLGSIGLAKITGTKDTTSLDAISDDRSVVVQATFKQPVDMFDGVFGMPNLARLRTILNIPEYSEDATIAVTTQERNGTKTLSGLNFVNKAGDFKNEYRFMAPEIISEKLKTVKFKGAKWGVDFQPTANNIQRLKFQASAHNDETTFIAKTDGDDLKFYFGDHSSHSGDFVFQAGVGGSLTRSWSWPVAVVIGILSLPGDKRMKFSDDGAAMITVDSGLINYEYILPAQTK